MKFFMIFVIVTISIMILTSFSQADIINVPGDYSTIQAAIDVSVNTDTVLVADGIFNVNNLIINNKNITIMSENGKESTFIDGQSTFKIMTIYGTNTDTTKIMGFTIQNGDALFNLGHVIEVESGYVVFDNLILENNGQGTGNQLFLGSGIDSTFFLNCIVRNNSSENLAGVSQSTVKNCLIYGNSGWNNTASVYLCHSINTTVCDNAGGASNPWTTGGIHGGTVVNCIVWNNQGYNGQQVYSNPIVTYSNIQGGYTGTGNINSDPLFVNAGGGDYHLQDSSPSIRTATPINCPIFDLEGTKRGNPPDMGAFENISDGDQSLPVSLTSFTAHGGDRNVSLKWVTESEVDNQGFIILKSNDRNGQYFELDSYLHNNDLVGAGNSSAQNIYKYNDKSVINGYTYWYKLVDVDINGVRTEHHSVSATPNKQNVDLDVIDNNIPQQYKLQQNYPNPFNPTTTISFSIPEMEEDLTNVVINVYDLLGRKIVTLFNSQLSSGSYQITWDGKNQFGNRVPSGVFTYNLITKNFIKSKKMILVK